MTGKLRWLRRLGCALLAAVVSSSSGCLSCLHPLGPVSKEQHELSCVLPQGCRNHVYLFFENGDDPFDCANLEGLCERLQELGYIKTYCGAWCHTAHFALEIRRLHREDATARFVLIGFGHGANGVRQLAGKVEPDGIAIDLMVYLGGCVKEAKPQDRPANVARVLNIQPGCWFGECPSLEKPTRLSHPEVSKYGAATHPQTVALVLRELAEVASRVPVIVKVPPTPPPPPVPHPATLPPPGPPAQRDDWDFLKPEQLPNPPTPSKPDTKKKEGNHESHESHESIPTNKSTRQDTANPTLSEAGPGK